MDQKDYNKELLDRWGSITFIAIWLIAPIVLVVMVSWWFALLYFPFITLYIAYLSLENESSDSDDVPHETNV